MSRGFPRHAMGSGQGVHPMPFKKDGDTRRRHRVDGGEADRDFSRPKKPHPRPHRRTPPNLPPTNMRHHGLEVTIAVSPWPTPRGRPDREEPHDQGRPNHNLAGGNNLHRLDGNRPDTTAGAHQARRAAVAGPPGGHPPPPVRVPTGRSSGTHQAEARPSSGRARKVLSLFAYLGHEE